MSNSENCMFFSHPTVFNIESGFCSYLLQSSRSAQYSTCDSKVHGEWGESLSLVLYWINQESTSTYMTIVHRTLETELPQQLHLLKINIPWCRDIKWYLVVPSLVTLSHMPWCVAVFPELKWLWQGYCEFEAFLSCLNLHPHKKSK